MSKSQKAQITLDNQSLWDLKCSWGTAEFTAVDGIGSMESLHQAGDSLVGVSRLTERGMELVGSGVMIGPGLLLTATHVLDEIEPDSSPVFATFLPDGVRIWLGKAFITSEGTSAFDERRKTVSDISLVSCSLNSDALEHRHLMLAPMQVALPLVGERLWAFGYRQKDMQDGSALVTPLVSSGLVAAAYPQGRGERMPAACIEVNMDSLGGMSGGPVVNDKGNVIGIVSSSLEGGPSYVTLIWDVLRHSIRSPAPWLPREKINLFGARDLGWVKLYGNVKDFRRGRVVLTMSEQETQLMLSSVDPSTVQEKKSVFTEDQMDVFMDEHGSTMERILGEVALDHLEKLPLDSVRACLGVLRIPQDCTAAITSFEVNDLEGTEDLEVVSNTKGDGSLVTLFCGFELQSVIWTVGVPTADYMAKRDRFDEHFMLADGDPSGRTTMQVVQHCYFEADLIFDQADEEFLHANITYAGVPSPRRSHSS